MSTDIKIAYDKLIQVFRVQPEEAGDKLVEFSNAFTSDEEMHFRSQLLKEDALVYGGNPEAMPSVIDQMTRLATEIHDAVLVGDKPEPSVIDLAAISKAWNEKPWTREVVYNCAGIGKSYPGSDFQLKDVHLTLRQGEITGVVGENGNGKTTLLKLIAGELLPDKDTGSFSYGVLQGDDRKPNWADIKRGIAYLPQELGRPVGHVRKSIQYSAALHDIKGAENDSQVKYIIQRLGLGRYQDASWEDLSGGFKLRFALATILVWRPKLIVLDEPLANLDINTQIKVLNDLKDLCRSIKHPIAVILSSQNIEEVENASDNMIVLREGQIIHEQATGTIGQERKTNLFEFRCNFERAELERCLKGIDHLGLDHNGFNYLIAVPLQVTELQFLKHCTRSNIALTYFQDISHSAKRYILNSYLTEGA